MLVDGAEPDVIRNILEVDVQTREHLDLQGAKVWEGMGIYAPTLGIIGAVMGLMAVLKNLADPGKLGHGIAAAFIATIYGIGTANLFRSEEHTSELQSLMRISYAVFCLNKKK